MINNEMMINNVEPTPTMTPTMTTIIEKGKKRMNKSNMNRLIKDIAEIYNNPLNSQGVYYIHDDEDMTKGYAMIIGSKNTPYENGAYFFEFNFPHTYPFKPPVLIYMTNDGITRFNPNLYRNGKVCLSIINTWHGEGWTSCQTIRSVLLSLVLVFNEKPLLNEPGVTTSHKDFGLYQSSIEYKNYEIAILRNLRIENIPSGFSAFYNIYKNYVIENEKNIIEKLDKLTIENEDSYSLYVPLYKMKVIIDYNKVNKEIKNTLAIIKG